MALPPPLPPPIPQSAMIHDAWELAKLMGIAPPPGARLPVTQQSVMGLPAANAAVSKIANAVAMMMVGADAYSDATTRIEPAPQVVLDPNIGYPGSFDFWVELVSTLLCRGNWVALPYAADGEGYPAQVQPIPIDAVHCYVSEEGRAVYDIGGVTYSRAEVIHLRYGYTVPGDPWAIGKVAMFRRQWAAQLDQQNMAASIYRESAVPSGIVNVDTDVPTKEQREYVEDRWQERYGGARRVPAVFGKKMSFQPLSWSPKDAEFLEARQMSVAETALIFGLRPEDLGAAIGGSSLTYGNRQDDAIQRIVDAYSPVMLPIEQAWSRLIPGARFVRGNPEALLRGTTRERYELHQLAQSIGLETTDETREIEGKPPLPKPDTPPPPPPNDNDENDDEPEEDAAA